MDDTTIRIIRMIWPMRVRPLMYFGEKSYKMVQAFLLGVRIGMGEATYDKSMWQEIEMRVIKKCFDNDIMSLPKEEGFDMFMEYFTETLKKEYIYMAALLDPHTSSELSIDDTRAMVDALIEAHGDWLPKFR